MGLDKGKIIGIVQLGFSLLAFILSIVALAGGVADNVGGLKSAGWMSMESSGMTVYTGWSHACAEFRGQSQCGESEWDKKDAATAMGALSFLFALANLVLVAVKLFKPNKMLSIIGCGVCFLGMIFTLAAMHRTQVPPTARVLARPSPASSSCSSLSSWASSRCSQAWRPPRLLVGSDRSLPRACATRPPRSGNNLPSFLPSNQGLRCEQVAQRERAWTGGRGTARRDLCGTCYHKYHIKPYLSKTWYATRTVVQRDNKTRKREKRE